MAGMLAHGPYAEFAVLLIISALAGAIAVVVFGFVSGNLVQMLAHMVGGWF